MDDAVKWLKNDATGDSKLYESPYKNKSRFVKFIAGFFKRKKHEWYVVGFIDDGGTFGREEVKDFYVHKGRNRNEVTTAPAELILEGCSQEGYNKVIELHNHPNGSLRPSKQDKSNFRQRYRKLASNNISLERYVCARGECKPYRRYF